MQHHEGFGRRHSINHGDPQDSHIYIPSITSDEILDERSNHVHKRRRDAKASRKIILILSIVLIVAIGAIAAYFVTKRKSTAVSSATDNEVGDKRSSFSMNNTSATKLKDKRTSDNSAAGGKGDELGTVITDPSQETYGVTFFALGDWGATTYAKNGSCCSRRKDSQYNAYDRHAEIGVSKLMAMEAKVDKPVLVLGHGDSFYWTGINGINDQRYRFQLTFEERHGEESMIDVPWINVMGNHDYGGGSFICSDESEKPRKCKDAADLVTNLKRKFTLQSSYKSPHADRWNMPDHYYTYPIKNKQDITIDVFNLDMNDAESHGALQICCQCYQYSMGDDKICKSVNRGHEFCAGGDGEMFDACMKQLSDWGEESRQKLVSEVKKSTATWKIVHSHYSPYAHYGETMTKTWMQLLAGLATDSNLHIWINGHTHGEKHDYAEMGMHFIENGAGGGIQSESASGIPPYAGAVANVWTASGLDDGNTYGFFKFKVSKTWLKIEFKTFDDKWSLTKDDNGLTSGTIGGVATKHCWYIPRDGGKGQACK